MIAPAIANALKNVKKGIPRIANAIANAIRAANASTANAITIRAQSTTLNTAMIKRPLPRLALPEKI
jgi:hypothetical protein